MKQVGILSDTHGFLDPALIPYFRECDEIWHAGDVGCQTILQELQSLAPLRAVHGNIDSDEVRNCCPQDQRFDCDGLDVWITHIAGRPGRYDRRVRELLRTSPPQILVAGHSHMLQVQRDRQYSGMVFINPGAAGRQGIHKVRTAVLIQVERAQIQRVQAVELS